MKKQTLIIAVVIAILVLLIAVGSYQFDGPVRPVDPQLAVILRESATWYEYPGIEASLTDPSGVYVLLPGMPDDHRFAALRIDVHTGEQMATRIEIGPQSSFRSFMPARVRAEIDGIRFRRPAAHLMTFPDGGGPGIHFTDSATGRINVVFDEGGSRRVLLTRKAFNSSSTEELLARVAADPTGRWIAAVWRDSSGWMLYLFSHTSTAAAQPTNDKSHETESR
jgi:hypothetical protein